MKNFGRYKRSVLELPELESAVTPYGIGVNILHKISNIKRIIFPKLVLTGSYNSNTINNVHNVEYIEYTSLKECRNVGSGFAGGGVYNSTFDTILYPSLEYATDFGNGSLIYNSSCKKILMPRLTRIGYQDCINLRPDANKSTNLIKIEIGDGFCSAVSFSYWCPSNALKTDSSDLVEDTSICSNNLEQFLYNFREYIVKRLATVETKTYVYLHETTKSYILGDYAQSWTVPGESETYYTSLNRELTNRNWGLA